MELYCYYTILLGCTIIVVIIMSNRSDSFYYLQVSLRACDTALPDQGEIVSRDTRGKTALCDIGQHDIVGFILSKFTRMP